MAERSNATSKKNQDAAQDVSTLQKRGRRRLVGAIALVLLAVIVLPMVFDPEPRQDAPAVSIRIPSEEGTKFTPKAAPRPGAPQPEAIAVAPKAPDPAPEIKATAPVVAVPVEKPAAKAEPKPAPAVEKPAAKVEPKAPEKKVPQPAPEKKAPQPAPQAAEKPPAAPAGTAIAGERFVVQVGAFASPEKVREITEKLKEVKLTHYAENVATANGQVTRIRLGPYDSKEAADKARERAKALGLSPANPIAK